MLTLAGLSSAVPFSAANDLSLVATTGLWEVKDRAHQIAPPTVSNTNSGPHGREQCQSLQQAHPLGAIRLGAKVVPNGCVTLTTGWQTTRGKW